MDPPATSREPCSSCEILYINNIRTHETGCPEAWKDYDIPCFECGCDFRPTERFQKVCEGCREDADNNWDDPAGGDDGFDSTLE